MGLLCADLVTLEPTAVPPLQSACGFDVVAVVFLGVFNLFYLKCKDVFLACLSVQYVCEVPERPKRASDPRNWSYRWLWAAVCMLETNPESSGRVACALIC